MFTAIQKINRDHNDLAFTLLVATLTLCNPLIGFVLFVSYSYHLKSKMYFLYCLIIPIYFVFFKVMNINLYEFISQFYIFKSKKMYFLSSIIPNISGTHYFSIAIIVALITPNFVSKHKTLESSYYIFIKLVLLCRLLSLLYIDSSLLQILLITGLNFNDNIIFITMYSSFIHISNYIAQYK